MERGASLWPGMWLGILASGLGPTVPADSDAVVAWAGEVESSRLFPLERFALSLVPPGGPMRVRPVGLTAGQPSRVPGMRHKPTRIRWAGVTKCGSRRHSPPPHLERPVLPAHKSF